MYSKFNYSTIVVFFILNLIIFNCNYQEKFPKLSFEHWKIDFGVVSLKDSAILFLNKIENIGNEKLSVLESKTICECTIINFDNSTPILPGEMRTLNIQFSPVDTGNLKIPIVFRSSDPEVFSTFYLVGKVVEK